MEILKKVLEVLVHPASLTILTVVFGIVKAVSNEKAAASSSAIMKGVAKLQAGWDKVIYVVKVLGEILVAACSLLEKVLKSDGIGGAK